MFYKGLIILVLFGFLSIGAIFKGEWYRTHDGLYHVVRVSEFYQMLTDGQFPVRWATNLYKGYGVPIFNYVYPGTYYLSSILMAVGLSPALSIRWLILIFYCLGGIGFYLIGRDKIGEFRAILVGMVYMLIPYQFVDIMVRGALGEVLALGLMPLIWWFFWQDKWKWHQSVLLAILLTCHNFLGFLFLGFLVVWGIVSGQFAKFRLFNIIMALGLSAFFWIPAIAEKSWLQSGGSNITFPYNEHFPTLRQLLYSKWGYWYSNPGVKDDGMTFQVGLAGWLVFLIGSVIAVMKNKPKELKWLVIFFGLTIFIMLPWSEPVWKNVKPLNMIQFPWRWLFMTTFLAPLILIKIMEGSTKIKGWLVLILVLIVAGVNVRNYRTPMHQVGDKEFRDQVGYTSWSTTTTAESEVMPKWYEKDIGGQEKIVGIDKKGSFVTEKDEEKVILGRSYFPTWVLKNAKGNKINIEPDETGLIKVSNIAKGKYNFEWESSPWEKLANLLSVISVVGLGLGWWRSRSQKKMD